MKKNLTEMIFILDRSGSMGYLVNDVIGGFNSMIESQKKEDGEAYVTTVLFDNYYEVLHNHVNVKEVQPITTKEYYARGTTALLDAIGTTVDNVGVRLFNTPEEERPEKVIIIINTDGLENDSRKYTRSKIKEMIEHQQDKYNWMFMFLGANMDAVAEASSLGIDQRLSKTWSATSIGVDSTYDALTSSISAMRCESFDFAEAKCCVDGLASITAALNTIDDGSDNSCTSTTFVDTSAKCYTDGKIDADVHLTRTITAKTVDENFDVY